MSFRLHHKTHGTLRTATSNVRWAHGYLDSFARQRAAAFRSTTPWAHHGLQRSGTNYTNLRLQAIGLRPLNAIDLRGSSPRGKHFRWQQHKDSIPPFLRDVYGNSSVVASLDELNRHAHFPTDCRHIIVKKQEVKWLASICNWGILCHWFSSPSSALKQIATLQKDYHHYYEFWERLAKKNPEKVLILPFEEVLTDFEDLLPKLHELHLEPTKRLVLQNHIQRVPRSPQGRTADITPQMVIDALA